MYSADLKLGGAINVYRNTWVYPQGTINIMEQTANDPERDLCTWNEAPFVGSSKRHCDHINLSWLKKNSPNPLLHVVYDDLHQTIMEYTKSYYADYGINENCYANECYSIVRYKRGDHYVDHYDGNTSLGRHISCLLYLNDDFEGGELYFNNFDITIKPEPGMLVLFPSNFAYRHEARPVTKGTKYAFVTWLHDRPNAKT